MLLGAVHLSADALDSRMNVHLPISVLIGGLIAVTQTFFITELLAQRLLYPLLFEKTRPADTPGAWPVSLRCRGVLWMVSAGVCPIVCLLLLLLAPPAVDRGPWFAIAVGAVGIGFGMTGAWMLGKLIAEPVDLLRRGSQLVAAGKLGVRVDLLRADEFGQLIDDFNGMVEQLREKQRLRETFGQHVGRESARQILLSDPGLGGVEQELTVVFADLRNFTARSAECSAQETVAMLNRFLTEMVEIIEEQHGGIVNKFLGDGLMALFGIAGGASDEADGDSDHADRALAAATRMLDRIEHINATLIEQNQAPLGMGVGIHTGPAVVGSIGSPRRPRSSGSGVGSGRTRRRSASCWAQSKARRSNSGAQRTTTIQS